MAPTADTRHATWRVGCSPATDRPTAIFTASDTQALGVIAAARELGLHVPDDLSVIGYDDIEAADYVGLTTIRQQLFESGRRGAEVLLAEIEARSERATGRPSGARAGGPSDHGASEGGPWMTTAGRHGTRQGSSTRRRSVHDQRSIPAHAARATRHGAIAAIAVATVLVAACAAREQ